MLITIDPITENSDATLSMLSVDNVFECFTLEDEYREEKVAAETRIPAGTYDIKLRTWGGFHERYKRKFPSSHRGMLWLRDVPNFKYILIHIGNTDEDTAGCILVGQQALADPRELQVLASTRAYLDFYKKVVDAAQDNQLQIQVNRK